MATLTDQNVVLNTQYTLQLSRRELRDATEEYEVSGTISLDKAKLLLTHGKVCSRTAKYLSASNQEHNSVGTESSQRTVGMLAVEHGIVAGGIKSLLERAFPGARSTSSRAPRQDQKQKQQPRSTLSLPTSIVMESSGDKRKRVATGVAGPVSKRSNDGDAGKSLQYVYDSGSDDDEEEEEEAEEEKAEEEEAEAQEEEAEAEAEEGAGFSDDISTLTDSHKKAKDEAEDNKTTCICGKKIDPSQLKNHLNGVGLTATGKGKSNHSIANHSRGMMERYNEAGEEGFNDLHRLCLDLLKGVFVRLLTDGNKQKLLAVKTETLFAGYIEVEGPYMLNFVRVFLPQFWLTYKSILPPGSAAADYAANMDLPALASNSAVAPGAGTKMSKPTAAASSSPSKSTEVEVEIGSKLSPPTKQSALFKFTLSAPALSTTDEMSQGSNGDDATTKVSNGAGILAQPTKAGDDLTHAQVMECQQQLEGFLRLRKMAKEDEDDDLVAKLNIKIRALKVKLFPDLYS